MNINTSADNAINYIDSLSIDELEQLFKSFGIDAVRKPDKNHIDTLSIFTKNADDV